MKRSIPLCLALLLALPGCGFDLARAQSILDAVTQSPLYEPARECVSAGLNTEGDAAEKARAVGRCLAFGLGGTEAAPDVADEDLVVIGEKALALERQVRETADAIANDIEGADALARGCRILESELASELDRCLGSGNAGR